MNYTRKSLAKEAGIGIETLRYYEKMELIKPPARASNGYRVYTEEDANKIKHILGAKKYGFSLREIKIMIDKAENMKLDSNDFEILFRDKIKDIDKQINELKSLKKLLIEYIDPAK
ncbi:MAG: MerR family transcriptional regulator [Brevinematales bacterium]|jgi:DNA-binding transcriptional MerR regulator